MTKELKLVVDIKKEIKDTGTNTEKAIFSSLQKITKVSSSEYIGSATFSMVVDSLSSKSSIFSFDSDVLTGGVTDGIFASPKANL